jgi:hypothetical protein
MALNYSYSSVNLSGQVTKSLKDVSQYITASAGGWPDYKVGMIAGYDFTIESGSGDVKIYEFNTNCACCYDAPIAPKVNGLAYYLSTQDIDTLYVYGVWYDMESQNPSPAFYNKLSASCAEHNISSSLILEQDYVWHGVYQGTGSYIVEESNWQIKSGSNEYTLFVSSPYKYPDLKPLSSGSFNKLNFRSILQRSPSSSLMIDEFDPTDSSFTPNGTYPDYIVKRQQYDRGLLSGKLGFYSYESDNFTLLSQSYENGHYYGYYPYYEKYIIGSGSDDVSGYSYNYEYSQIFLHSHDGIIDLGAEQCSHRLIPSSSDDVRKWDIVPSIQYRHIASSGSTISMFDGSTKQVQDLVVGDNVKALNISGLNPQSSDFATFTQASMSGSITGSRIIDIDSKIIPAYYYVNNKYKLPDNYGRFAEKSGLLYQFTPSSEIYSNNKFVSSSGEDISITSLTYVISDETYYAVDLGGDDLFYVNDILVHS